MGSELVHLHVKYVFTGESFTIFRNWASAGRGSLPRVSKASRCQSIRIKQHTFYKANSQVLNLFAIPPLYVPWSLAFKHVLFFSFGSGPPSPNEILRWPRLLKNAALAEEYGEESMI